MEPYNYTVHKALEKPVPKSNTSKQNKKTENLILNPNTGRTMTMAIYGNC